jgi:hypothetical protein
MVRARTRWPGAAAFTHSQLQLDRWQSSGRLMKTELVLLGLPHFLSPDAGAAVGGLGIWFPTQSSGLGPRAGSAESPMYR